MICGWTCFVAAMFIIANVLFTFLMDKHGAVKDYQESLDATQKKVYEKIVNERKNLALQGYGLGLGLSIGFLVGRHFLTKSKKSLLSASVSGLCFTVAITFIVQYFYYMLMPKKDWMLHYLNTDKQKEHWMKVYRAYSWNYHLSIVLGLVGAGLLGYGLC
jgi:ABC-type thiamin/hydroxymethylpyrimidine transport system permease subunit